MNKWTFRLIGLIIVLLITAIIFRNWFFPTVPPILQHEISLQVNGKEQMLKPSTPAAAKDASSEELPLTLTSLDDGARGKGASDPAPAGQPQEGAPSASAAAPAEDEGEESAQVAQNQPNRQNAPRQQNAQSDVTSAAASAQSDNNDAPAPKPAPAPETPAETIEVTQANTPQPAETIEVTAERTNKRRRGNWVQAGAFSSKENADNFVAKLKRRSWPVVTEDAVVNGKLMHRVLVGPLSRSDVDVYIDILGKMGFNARQVSR